MSGNAVAPAENFRAELASSSNIFRDRFGGLSDEQWRDLLIRSLDEPVIDGLEFPGFPAAELQTQIHGHAAAASLHEAYSFYRYVKKATNLAALPQTGVNFLDFGAGWGRISRLFLRDFELSRMFGFEPNLAFCTVARALNPYMCFLNGDYRPDGTLPPDRFDIVVGWSVFSHLSPDTAAAWLEEMVRVVRKDGYCVFTTWGERFLDRLIAERDQLARGKPIDWYSERCLQAAGDIAQRRERYRYGEFVWFTGHQSTTYGEAFLPPPALRRLLQTRRIKLELVEFDQTTLAQDVFVLRRA